MSATHEFRITVWTSLVQAGGEGESKTVAAKCTCGLAVEHDVRWPDTVEDVVRLMQDGPIALHMRETRPDIVL